MVKWSDKLDYENFLENVINYRASTLNRDSEDEIKEFNTLVNTYKSCFVEDKTLKESENIKKQADAIMDSKKHLFKEIKIKPSAPIREEFKMTNLKDLIKKDK